ncbi:MAG: hypothetical protein KDB01_21440 [Planctomycetaceae bacterium]|nr:hypothetical protein [Planctomycetaceae bacterium]
MLLSRIHEFNPIDNLAPLAKAAIPIYHIYSTADEIVPLQPNSEELARRYRAHGGQIHLEIMPGGKHGGEEFYTSQAAADFITSTIQKFNATSFQHPTLPCGKAGRVPCSKLSEFRGD